MVFDNQFFDTIYTVMAFSAFCCVVSFAAILLIRHAGKGKPRAKGERRNRPKLRFILNVAVWAPLCVIALAVLWLFWFIQSNYGLTPDTQFYITIAALVLYSVLLIAAVFFIRRIGKNKLLKEGERRSHPLLRIALNVAAWMPLAVMIALPVWLWASRTP